MRIVLVGWAEDDWRIYRQAQWMGEVRSDPEAATRPKRHFDIEEDAFRDVLGRWGPERLGADSQAADSALAAAGAAEVKRP